MVGVGLGGAAAHRQDREAAPIEVAMLLAATVLFLLTQSMPQVVFESEVWPGEGRPVFAAVGARLPLRESPDQTAEVVATWAGRPGQELEFDDTRYRTTRAGRFIVLNPTTLTGRQLGDTNRLSRADYYSGVLAQARIDLTTGDVVDYLQYRAEGTCFVALAGLSIDADRCPSQQPKTYRLASEPQVEWWIHIADGDLEGWVLVADTTVRVLRRQF